MKAASDCRYYELKMTLEETETTEEITHVPERRRTSSRLRSSSSSGETTEPLMTPQSDILPGGFAAKHEAVATEQLTTSSCEERQRFVINAVIDPRTDEQITLQVVTKDCRIWLFFDPRWHMIPVEI